MSIYRGKPTLITIPNSRLHIQCVGGPLLTWPISTPASSVPSASFPSDRLDSLQSIKSIEGKGLTVEARVEMGQFVGGSLPGGIGFTAGAGVERVKTFVHGILNHPVVH